MTLLRNFGFLIAIFIVVSGISLLWGNEYERYLSPKKYWSKKIENIEKKIKLEEEIHYSTIAHTREIKRNSETRLSQVRITYSDLGVRENAVEELVAAKAQRIQEELAADEVIIQGTAKEITEAKKRLEETKIEFSKYK